MTDAERGVQMKAIVVTDQAAGTAGMTLVERPKPKAAINDVFDPVHEWPWQVPKIDGANREAPPRRQPPVSHDPWTDQPAATIRLGHRVAGGAQSRRIDRSPAPSAA